MPLRARVPASTSNLGPGFDVLGLALELYVEVEVHEASRLILESEGEGSELPQDAAHLAAATVIEVLGHDHVLIRVRSQIPLGRGLGSSAALVVAAAAAAGASDPLAIAAASDGHPENAAASYFGGLVAGTVVDGTPIVRRLGLDPSLSFVVLIPERTLSTKAAREALPASVPFSSATHNLGRLALLIAGLAKGEELVAAAGEDLLHQGPRSALFPQAPELLGALRSAGATVACWSGAGPSLLGICMDARIAHVVRDEGERALSTLGIAGRAVVLDADRTGLVLSEVSS